MKKLNYWIIVFSLIFTVVIMPIGYAKLTGVLGLTGSATITGKWDVQIINIEEHEKIGSPTSNSLPSHTALNAFFDVTLNKPGDSIKYKVSVQNKGNIDAKLDSIQILPKPNLDDVILYSVDNYIIGNVLKPNEIADFYVTVKYNSNKEEVMQEKKTIVSIEYKQND